MTTVKLSTPIKRSTGEVAELTLRKPATGEVDDFGRRL